MFLYGEARFSLLDKKCKIICNPKAQSLKKLTLSGIKKVPK